MKFNFNLYSAIMIISLALFPRVVLSDVVYTPDELRNMIGRGEYPNQGELEIQTKIMTFPVCKVSVDAIINEIRDEYPVKIMLNTKNAYVVKAWLNDGPITATCSGFDNKMILTNAKYMSGIQSSISKSPLDEKETKQESPKEKYQRALIKSGFDNLLIESSFLENDHEVNDIIRVFSIFKKHEIKEDIACFGLSDFYKLGGGVESYAIDCNGKTRRIFVTNKGGENWEVRVVNN